MNNIMLRMGVVIGVLVAVQLGFLYVGHLAHPSVIEPQRPIEDFPMVFDTPALGTWEGKNAELDSRTIDETQADSVISRIYSKEARNLEFLLAEYRQPSVGLYHSPMNCYRAQGFTLVGNVEWLPLKARGRPDVNVSVSIWARNSEKVIVVYWYEIGDHTLYERHDLLKAQWAMLGKTKWPVLFKVLLAMPVGEAEVSKAEILDMAQFVRQWLGQVQPIVD